MSFKPGQQIAYIPSHANENINHPDVEFGFVTSVNDSYVFCRFFRNRGSNELRTMANSEACRPEDLIPFEHHKQGEINILLKGIQAHQ